MGALVQVLAVSLSQADGGLAEVYAACPDGPHAVEVDGGFFLPNARAARVSCRLAGCEAYVAQTERPVPTFSQPALVLMAVLLVAGLVGGALGGFEFGRWLFGR